MYQFTEDWGGLALRMAAFRVLFVCVGNSCRSQMAEGFAKTYGKDVLEATSAGLFPATIVAPITIKMMRQRGIDMQGHYPKSLHEVELPFDIVVNISGYPIPHSLGRRIIEWKVQDPLGQKESIFQQVATQIENHVMQLVMELRLNPPALATAG